LAAATGVAIVVATIAFAVFSALGTGWEGLVMPIEITFMDMEDKH
jgi:hypothetical protein